MNRDKIVASDLDGTLLNNMSMVSQENLDAIETLCARGVHLVPSTGRTYKEIPTQIKNNEHIRYFIYSNGAVLFDKCTGNRILNCISNKTCREIYDLIKNYEADIGIRHNGQLVIGSVVRDEAYYRYNNVIDAHVECITNYAATVEDFPAYLDQADDVEVFTAFFHDYADKMYCKKQLEKNPALRVVESGEYNIEIFSSKAGKDNALFTLADLLHVSREETISMGDTDNDSKIVQAAGLGLAVSNACESLKAVADEIICSNEEHVMPYLVSHYFSDASASEEDSN